MELFYSLQYGRSPLDVATEKGHTAVVDILVKHGADINTKDGVRNLYEFMILSSATILDDVHV